MPRNTQANLAAFNNADAPSTPNTDADREENPIREALEAYHNDTNEITTDAAAELIDRIDIDHLTDRCEGRGGRLRTSKPTANGDTGLEQYTWRMAYFHAGGDSSIPVMARCWLSEYLENEGISANVTGSTDDAGEEIVSVLELVADVVLLRLGEDPSGAARAWNGIIA